MKVRVIFLRRIETEASKAAWAKATERVNAEYDRLMAQQNLLRQGVISPQMVEPPKMPGYTVEEAKARDFSQAYKVFDFTINDFKDFKDAGLAGIPDKRDMVTLPNRGTWVVVNREFVYQELVYQQCAGGDIKGVDLDTLYVEVWPYNEPMLDAPESELRAYGNTPPISQVEIVPKPED